MKPSSSSLAVIIIGSGFGGQCAAIQLKRMGIHDFKILERRSFLGGTWVQNTYPGAAVDVQSPLYSFSFEPYDWSQMFAEQDELKEYTEHVLEKYALHEHAELNTTVVEARWDDEDNRWHVKSDDGREFVGQFLINASGPLSTPVVPPFKGKDSFEGASFHTNDWDHDYDYRDKRVAVIGSGASAAQVIPAIVDDVSDLYVFQRTPHWVLPRPDHRFSDLERRMLRNPAVYQALRQAIYWGLETRVIGMKYSERMLKLVAQTRSLRFLSQQVMDPVLREKLTPDYTIGCKRIIL
ncbi:MAG: NAD(P)/FAD-dependent oxidoreductase, partial [Polyangiales bacterium]